MVKLIDPGSGQRNLGIFSTLCISNSVFHDTLRLSMMENGD